MRTMFGNLKDKITGVLNDRSDTAPMFESSFQLLVNHLFASTSEHKGIKTLLFTGAMPHCGVTTLTIGFAEYLSRHLLLNALVIDANYLNPGIPGMFRCNNSPGFSDLLCGKSQLMDVVLDVTPNLHVIPPGERDMLSKTLMSFQPTDNGVLETISRDYDIVLIDAAPITKSPAIFTLSAMVHGVLLVAHAEKTRREALRAAKEQLEFSGAKIVGGILNRRRFHIPYWIYSRLS